MAHGFDGRSDPYNSASRVVQFATTEKEALAWATKNLWSRTAEATSQFISLTSQLSGPGKFIPFKYETYGSYIRGIEAPLLEGQSWSPWRQKLVDFILSYRRHFAGSYENGGGQASALKVNFHELDPSVFPDEWVQEGLNARRIRFVVQRYLFGIACNTNCEVLGRNVQAYTDWDFTGNPPFVETCKAGVWIDAAHNAGCDSTTLHGYQHSRAADHEWTTLTAGGVGAAPGTGATVGYWRQVLSDCPWLDARVHDPDPSLDRTETLFPIKIAHKRFDIRAKDINDAATVAWRQEQPPPAPVVPPAAPPVPISAQPGDFFGGAYIFSHGITLNPNPTYRSQRVMHADQYDHTCIETARWLISICNYRKMGQAEAPW